MRRGHTLNFWARFHQARWYWRLPLKGLLLGLTILAVCYPNPSVLARHLRHIRDPDAMIQADAPPLAPLLADLRPRLQEAGTARAVLDTVEQYVCTTIDYAYDWETWGVVDYLPTVEEVVSSGREDCDGRALLAASLLRGLGYEARLVADGAHVWVWTPQGETMNPNPQETLRATTGGVHIDWTAWRTLPRALGFGLAIFPLGREVIVAAVLLLILLHPRIKPLQAGTCAVLLGTALALVRCGGKTWDAPVLWMQLAGLACLLAAVILGPVGQKPRQATCE